MSRTPPKYAGNITDWADKLHEFLLPRPQVASRVSPQAVLLAHKVPSAPASAAVNGVLMYDPVVSRPVVSVAGAFVPFLLAADASGSFTLNDGSATVNGVFILDDGAA